MSRSRFRLSLRSSRPRRLLVVLLAVSLAVATVPVFGAPSDDGTTSIDSCTSIETPGRYVLSSDIETDGADTCIEIRADGVTLDGRGHSIDGEKSHETDSKTDRRSGGNNGSSGLSVRGANDVTVRNLTATRWGVGVRLTDTTGGTLRNVRVAENDRSGVRLDAATGTSLTNVTAVANVNPELRPFPGPSESAGIVVAGGTDTRIVDANLTRNVGGVSFVRSANGVVDDAVAQSNEVGFLLSGTNDTVRNSVAAGHNVAFFADNASDGEFSNVDAVSNRVGIGIENSTNTTVSDSTADSGLLGVSVIESRGVTLDNATTTDQLAGVNFLNSSDGALTASKVEDSDFTGVGLVGTTATRISNTTIAASKATTSLAGATSSGVYLNDSQARLRDVRTANNENWTVFAERGSSLRATNLSLDGRRLSFSGRNVALDATNRPKLPPTLAPVSRPLVVDGTSPKSVLSLRLEYDPGSVVAGVDEGTVGLWRYDGDWSKVADSRSVDGAPAVVANVSRPKRSVVAVLGERNESSRAN